MTQTKAAIYCRVSTEMQFEKGYSIQEQELICQKRAQEKAYEVVGVYRDEVSGASYDRQEMNVVLELGRQKQIQKVLVQELDRFARDATALIILEHQLQLYGVEVEYVLNDFQPGPIGDFHKTIAVGVAQLEKEMIKERTRRGRFGKVRQGKVLSGSKAPYGYFFKDDMFHIEEDEAKIVRLIFDWYVSERVGMIAIARRLSEMNVSTRGDKLNSHRKKRAGVWGLSTIQNMIKNETYCGIWRYNKSKRIKGSILREKSDPSEQVEVQVPAIIEQRVFEQAQKQRELNTAHNKRRTKYEYLLSGMMYCVHCGRKFYVSTTYQRNERAISYYRCGRQQRHHRESFDDAAPTCNFSYLPAKKIDETVWGIVSHIIKNPDLILESIRSARSANQEEGDTFTLRVDILNTEIGRTVEQEKRLLGLFLSNKVDQVLLESKAGELKKLRQDLEKQVIELKRQLNQKIMDERQATEIVDYCSIMALGLDLLTQSERRDVLHLLQIRVYVDREKEELTVTGLTPLTVASYTSPINWIETRSYSFC